MRARNTRLPPEVNRYDALASTKKGTAKYGGKKSHQQHCINLFCDSCGSTEANGCFVSPTGFYWFCRILYVRNLPFNISSEEVSLLHVGLCKVPLIFVQQQHCVLLAKSIHLISATSKLLCWWRLNLYVLQMYDIFGKYGAIRQIRL